MPNHFPLCDSEQLWGQDKTHTHSHKCWCLKPSLHSPQSKPIFQYFPWLKSPDDILILIKHMFYLSELPLATQSSGHHNLPATSPPRYWSKSPSCSSLTNMQISWFNQISDVHGLDLWWLQVLSLTPAAANPSFGSPMPQFSRWWWALQNWDLLIN